LHTFNCYSLRIYQLIIVTLRIEHWQQRMTELINVTCQQGVPRSRLPPSEPDDGRGFRRTQCGSGYGRVRSDHELSRRWACCARATSYRPIWRTLAQAPDEVTIGGDPEAISRLSVTRARAGRDGQGRWPVSMQPDIRQPEVYGRSPPDDAQAARPHEPAGVPAVRALGCSGRQPRLSWVQRPSTSKPSTPRSGS
jgi:hypothetical protein